MDEIFPVTIILLAGTTVAYVLAQQFQGRLRALVLLSFFAHTAAVFAQIWITQNAYSGGDIIMYALKGEILSSLLRSNFEHFGPDMLLLLVHGQPVLPIAFAGAGTSTGAMTALATLLTYFTSGGIYSLSLITATWAFSGKVAMFRALTESSHNEAPLRVLIAVLLVPSTVFWSSGLLKESVAMGGMGYLVYGLHLMLRGRRFFGILLAIAGAGVVASFKAYVLFAFAVAAGPWMFFESSPEAGRAVRPVHLLLGGVLAVLGVILLGKVFPKYALENLAEQAAYRQEIGQVVKGGSSYDFGDPTERTLVGQIAFAPLALISSLFRPFIWEARNAQIAVNGFETLVLMLMLVKAVAQLGLRRIVAAIMASPVLLFCGIFTLAFGTAVGLTTTNLGTLSRYRMPLMPFFCVLLFLLDARARRQRTLAPAPALRQEAIQAPPA